MQDIALGEQAGQRVEVAGGRLLEAVADRGLVLRLEYVVSAAGLIQEVLLLVGTRCLACGDRRSTKTTSSRCSGDTRRCSAD